MSSSFLHPRPPPPSVNPTLSATKSPECVLQKTFLCFCFCPQNTQTWSAKKLSIQRTCRNLHAQHVLWSMPLSSRLGSSLLNICTLSPQQPQQTQQPWNPIQAGTSLSRTHLFTAAFGSHLTCSAPVPVHPSSHPRLSIRCSKSSLRLCPSLPPLCSFNPPPSCSVTLSLYRSTVAHAAESLYLIHYNTSRLTLSQMGGWVSLLLANWSAGCLSSCCAPLLLPPGFLAVHALLIHKMTRNPGLCCLLPSAIKKKALSRQDLSTIQAAASKKKKRKPLNSCHLLFISRSLLSIFVQFLLLNTTWPLQCDIPACHIWERLLRQPGLHLSFTSSLSLFLFHSLPPHVLFCHVITLNSPPPLHSQQWRSSKKQVRARFVHSMLSLSAFKRQNGVTEWEVSCKTVCIIKSL